ncbi:unnamed protein product [Tilletia caries]|nr:hypothetical protein CF335_g6875 [Tilletia laevis]CAD6960043.1 unnamed protein product [Tilletia caries]CAD7066885.1 unnamed protein product [Tilletia caries]
MRLAASPTLASGPLLVEDKKTDEELDELVDETNCADEYVDALWALVDQQCTPKAEALLLQAAKEMERLRSLEVMFDHLFQRQQEHLATLKKKPVTFRVHMDGSAKLYTSELAVRIMREAAEKKKEAEKERLAKANEKIRKKGDRAAKALRLREEKAARKEERDRKKAADVLAKEKRAKEAAAKEAEKAAQKEAAKAQKGNKRGADNDSAAAGWRTGIRNAEWSSDGIELYRPKNEAADEHHSRPALLGPLGKGHGSVKYTIKAKDDTFTVVTIHCIAELMKELASSIDRSGTLPKRVDAMILTQFIWQSLITTLKDLDAILTDDTRIRVTVRARTLKDALEKVRNLPLLNLEEYLHPIHPDFQAFQVRKHVVPASAFVEQATRLQRHV